MADNTLGYACKDSSSDKLVPHSFHRRDLKPDDVEIDVKFCGVCHTDLHQIRNDWQMSNYPLVPGHEISGVVSKTGADVKGFKVGDHVGVGYYVNSCRTCDACEKNLEQYCPKCVLTCDGQEVDGTRTYGGYSSRMVCNENYVLKIPANLPLDGAAPLMCAGITVYSPMAHYGLTEPGKKLGIVGLGGLGHMAVKIGKAFGLKVVVISTSPNKKEESLNLLKADEFLVAKDEEAMKAAASSLDYILDTVSAKHSLSTYLSLLKVDGKYVIVGAPPEPYQLSPAELIFGRKQIGGSLTGGIKEAQEMLDFCGKHNITANTETISIDYINTALERLEKADVKYRFVIDLSTLKP